MTLTATKRTELISAFRRNDTDTGSPEVQVAILTERIRELTEHLKVHKHDFSTKRGLTGMVSTRSRLLRYLSRTDYATYKTLISQLGLRK